jgi:hypothetical protein
MAIIVLIMVAMLDLPEPGCPFMRMSSWVILVEGPDV